jgi:putative hydrolase of the HAD superfamily
MPQALFLDLDDTIFSSDIPYEVFRELFDILDEINDSVPTDFLPVVKKELFSHTFYEVSLKYTISHKMILGYLNHMKNISFRFNIRPYPDYHLIQQLPHSKYLITSGSRIVQEAKINALDISADFRKICYDDRFHGSKGKKHLFEKLLEEENLNRTEVLVIGDNLESEIKAAKYLGLPFVHVNRAAEFPELLKSRTISSFEQIHHFI